MALRLPAPRLLPITIAVLAALLVVKSAVLVRAAIPETHAGSSAPAAPPPPARPVAAAPAAPAPPPPAPPADPPVSDAERALLLDLRHRRAELDAREAALASRESVLAGAESRLTARVDELTALQAKLEGLEAARQKRDEANWQGLVKLYESMKPRDAAAIFNDLDKDVLLQVLDRMKEMRAAPVLAAMQPERARQVTADLAQMRQRANRVPAAAPAPPPRG